MNFQLVEISSLWWPLQNIKFVTLKPLCNRVGRLLRVIVHLENPFVPKLLLPGQYLQMLLQCFHIIFFPHHAISFVTWTSPSCSITSALRDAATPIVRIWDGVRRLANLSLYGTNVMIIILDKKFNFSFIKQQDKSPKIQSCCGDGVQSGTNEVGMEWGHGVNSGRVKL